MNGYNVPLTFAGGAANSSANFAAVSVSATDALTAALTFTSAATSVTQATAGVTYTWEVTGVTTASGNGLASDVDVQWTGVGIPTIQLTSNITEWAAADTITLTCTVSFNGTTANQVYNVTITL